MKNLKLSANTSVDLRHCTRVEEGIKVKDIYNVNSKMESSTFTAQLFNQANLLNAFDWTDPIHNEIELLINARLNDFVSGKVYDVEVVNENGHMHDKKVIASSRLRAKEIAQKQYPFSKIGAAKICRIEQTISEVEEF